jgi:RNA recognition motif-containing protein
MHMLNLIVRNLDPSTTKEEFDEFFSNFGEIRSSRIVSDAMLGFVCYKERESARKAKETPNLVLRGRDILVFFCEPKETRQKQLEEKWDKKAYEKHRNSVNKSSN